MQCLQPTGRYWGGNTPATQSGYRIRRTGKRLLISNALCCLITGRTLQIVNKDSVLYVDI